MSPLDWKDRPHSSAVRRLPAVVDLRRHCPPVYDQLHLNSCSANAIAAALRFAELKEGRGMVPVPRKRDPFHGGHAVLAVGYQHARKLIIVRNSWGRAWDHGCGYLPYAVFASADLTWDFWTMRRVS